VAVAQQKADPQGEAGRGRPSTQIAAGLQTQSRFARATRLNLEFGSNKARVLARSLRAESKVEWG
jgi:hypothetical protein